MLLNLLKSLHCRSVCCWIKSLGILRQKLQLSSSHVISCLSEFTLCAHLPGLSCQEGENSPRAAFAQPGVCSRRSAPSALPAPVGHPSPGPGVGNSPWPPHHGVLSPAGLLFPVLHGGLRGRSLSPAPRSVPEVPDELPAWAQGPCVSFPVCHPLCAMQDIHWEVVTRSSYRS